MLILAALLLAAPYTVVVFSQPFLEQHGVSIAMFGVAQAPTRAAGMIASLVAYRVSGAIGFRWTFIGGFVLLAGAYALLGGWDSVSCFAGIGVALIIMSLLLPVVVVTSNQRIPSNQRAIDLLPTATGEHRDLRRSSPCGRHRETTCRCRRCSGRQQDSSP
jgi:hypothetical protein